MEISIPGTEVSWCQRAFLRKLGHPKLIVISHSIQYTLLDIPSKLHVCFYLVLLGSCFGADRINLKMMKWQVSQATLGFSWDCFFGIHLRTWPPTRQKPFRPMKLILPSFLRTVIFFWAQLKTLVRKKLGCVTDYSFFGRVAIVKGGQCFMFWQIVKDKKFTSLPRDECERSPNIASRCEVLTWKRHFKCRRWRVTLCNLSIFPSFIPSSAIQYNRCAIPLFMSPALDNWPEPR